MKAVFPLGLPGNFLPARTGCPLPYRCRSFASRSPRKALPWCLTVVWVGLGAGALPEASWAHPVKMESPRLCLPQARPPYILRLRGSHSPLIAVSGLSRSFGFGLASIGDCLLERGLSSGHAGRLPISCPPRIRRPRSSHSPLIAVSDLSLRFGLIWR